MRLILILSILPFLSLGQRDSLYAPPTTSIYQDLQLYNSEPNPYLFIYPSDLASPYLNEETIALFIKSDGYYSKGKEVKRSTNEAFKKFNNMISKVGFDPILNPIYYSKYNYVKVLEATINITVPSPRGDGLSYYLQKTEPKSIRFRQIKGTIFSFSQGKHLVAVKNRPVYIGNTSRFETYYEYWVRI